MSEQTPIEKDQNVPVETPKAVPAQQGKAANPNNEKKNTNTSKMGRNKKKGIIETEPVVGTRDFFPQDMRLRNWLFGHFREVARSFAFQEYDAPVLEFAELYQRKSGEEITQQMYHFTDKDDYHLSLRPEMTPSLARMVLKMGRRMLMPIRWFSIPQCWRHEDIKRGRKREHYQWNMDIWGVSSITAEIELLAAMVALFKRVGLTSKDVGIKVNSRQVLHDVLKPLGITDENFAPVCVIVDKLEKLPMEEVNKQFQSLNLSDKIIDAITKTLSVKSLADLKDLLPGAPVIEQMQQLWTLAAAYEIEDWLVFDASVVRGLAYYTGIVFEAFDRGGTMRAIAGGGRYDRLLSIYGSKQDIAACGFGFGDCVIVEFLKDKGLLPNFDVPEIDDIVIPFSEELRPAACQVAAKLRSQGRRVDIQLMNKKKLTDTYTYADRVGAQRAVLVAPDEWSRGLVRVKLLREGAKEKGAKTEKDNEAEAAKEGASDNQVDILFADL